MQAAAAMPVAQAFYSSQEASEPQIPPSTAAPAMPMAPQPTMPIVSGQVVMPAHTAQPVAQPIAQPQTVAQPVAQPVAAQPRFDPNTGQPLQPAMAMAVAVPMGKV